MKYKYGNSINFHNRYHSISLKTHLSRGEFFPNGINRNIYKKQRASASPHGRPPREPSEDRTLTCPRKSPVTKAKCPPQWLRAWTQPKPARCLGLLSASTNLPGVEMEKYLGSCCLEFRSSLLVPSGLLPLPASRHQATQIGGDRQLSELKQLAKTSNHAPKCPGFSAMTSIFLIKLSVHCT